MNALLRVYFVRLVFIKEKNYYIFNLEISSLFTIIFYAFIRELAKYVPIYIYTAGTVFKSAATPLHFDGIQPSRHYYYIS